MTRKQVPNLSRDELLGEVQSISGLECINERGRLVLGRVIGEFEAIPDAPLSDGVPVHVAWTNVMADMGAIGKARRGPQEMGSFAYRGIDDVLDSLAPVLAKHRVTITPEIVDHTVTLSGKMRVVSLVVRYHVCGPAGDYLKVPPMGMGDGMSGQAQAPNIAMSNAFKTCMFQALCIPVKDTTVDSEEGPAHDYTEPPPAVWDPQVAAALTSRWAALPHELSEKVGDRLSKAYGVKVQRVTDVQATPQNVQAIERTIELAEQAAESHESASDAPGGDSAPSGEHDSGPSATGDTAPALFNDPTDPATEDPSALEKP